MYKSHNIMSLLRDIKRMSRDRIFLSHDKNVDFTGVLLCCATLFECLRHNHLSLYDKFLACDVTSLIYCFLDPAGTGNLLSKHALGIL